MASLLKPSYLSGDWSDSSLSSCKESNLLHSCDRCWQIIVLPNIYLLIYAFTLRLAHSLASLPKIAQEQFTTLPALKVQPCLLCRRRRTFVCIISLPRFSGNPQTWKIITLNIRSAVLCFSVRVLCDDSKKILFLKKVRAINRTQKNWIIDGIFYGAFET